MIDFFLKMTKLTVRNGDKLSVKQGAGLTRKGRKRYNRDHGSHLKAPAPHPKTKKHSKQKKKRTQKRKRELDQKQKRTSKKGKENKEQHRNDPT